MGKNSKKPKRELIRTTRSPLKLRKKMCDNTKRYFGHSDIIKDIK